ncbi:rhomboid family-domain-containing protein [Amylostereum chailletii]|nr:rhomboid family-domain-containing protein [Amylostereum chailletii]
MSSSIPLSSYPPDSSLDRYTPSHRLPDRSDSTFVNQDEPTDVFNTKRSTILESSSPSPRDPYDHSRTPSDSGLDGYHNPYSDDPSKNTYQGYSDRGDSSLVGNAAKFSGVNDYHEPEYLNPKDTAQTPLAEDSRGPLARFFNPIGRYPIEQRIENKRRGIGRQQYPVVSWVLSVVMISVFIYELVLNSRQQGTPVSFKPVVNPMLGPSTSAFINLGARFPPCMKNVLTVPIAQDFPCMNDTANPPDELCPFSDLCGFGGIPTGEDPNQWWRFITPIFLHAGFIHIILNLLAQLTAGAQIEREMGSAGFLILYFAAGIFGNVLGGNFALVGVPSVGASGAIFGSIAVTWVDLFAHWKIIPQPGRRLAFMTIELVIGVALGFIPYVDNFAHLGGFLIGVLVGTTLYPVISTTKRHKIIMWCFRVAAIPLFVVLYVVLIRNFYTSDPYAACSWCRYLSCIPSGINNHCKG